MKILTCLEKMCKTWTLYLKPSIQHCNLCIRGLYLSNHIVILRIYEDFHSNPARLSLPATIYRTQSGRTRKLYLYRSFAIQLAKLIKMPTELAEQNLCASVFHIQTSFQIRMSQKIISCHIILKDLLKKLDCINYKDCQFLVQT